MLLKAGVNDPQGLSIRGGLHSLGFRQVEEVRAGKILMVRLTAASQAEAESAVDQMCARLLANPVIERYSFTVREADGSAATAP